MAMATKWFHKLKILLRVALPPAPPAGGCHQAKAILAVDDDGIVVFLESENE